MSLWLPLSLEHTSMGFSHLRYLKFKIYTLNMLNVHGIKKIIIKCYSALPFWDGLLLSIIFCMRCVIACEVKYLKIFYSNFFGGGGGVICAFLFFISTVSLRICFLSAFLSNATGAIST